jgi:hypothetical protein
LGAVGNRAGSLGIGSLGSALGTLGVVDVFEVFDFVAEGMLDDKLSAHFK